MTHLRSLYSGREWLWRNPHLAATTPKPGDSYIRDHDLGGWDELLPTVAPCVVGSGPWGGRALTDHGEIWCRPCGVIQSAEPNRLGLVTAGDDLPFWFERHYRVDDDLQIEYRLTNTGDESLPFIWAAHPLIAIEPGMRVHLPDGTRTICTEAYMREPELALGNTFDWPWAPTASGGRIDLGTLGERTAGVAVKIFATLPEGPEGWVEIVAPGGDEALRLSFDRRDTPYVGLWLNDGGWSGSGSPPYFNLGVEPTNYPGDALRDAVNQNAAAIVPGRGSRTWRLTVSMGAP